MNIMKHKTRENRFARIIGQVYQAGVEWTLYEATEQQNHLRVLGIFRLPTATFNERYV